MCGIFGLITLKSSNLSRKDIISTVNSLFLLSESRGKEASGIAACSNDTIYVYKNAKPASALIKEKEYKKLINMLINKNKDKTCNNSVAIIGHSRLVTNGPMESNENNQPVLSSNIVGVHNGIVANVEYLWNRYGSLQRKHEVDTEIILSLFHYFYKQNNSLGAALNMTYKNIEGSASIALMPADSDHTILATNTGSLYVCVNKTNNICIFASELYILTKLIKMKYLSKALGINRIFQIKAGEAVIIHNQNLATKIFNFKNNKQEDISLAPVSKRNIADSTTYSNKPNQFLQSRQPEYVPQSYKMLNLKKCKI